MQARFTFFVLFFFTNIFGEKKAFQTRSGFWGLNLSYLFNRQVLFLIYRIIFLKVWIFFKPNVRSKAWDFVICLGIILPVSHSHFLQYKIFLRKTCVAFFDYHHFCFTLKNNSSFLVLFLKREKNWINHTNSQGKQYTCLDCSFQTLDEFLKLSRVERKLAAKTWTEGSSKTRDKYKFSLLRLQQFYHISTQWLQGELWRKSQKLFTRNFCNLRTTKRNSQFLICNSCEGLGSGLGSWRT